MDSKAPEGGDSAVPFDDDDTIDDPQDLMERLRQAGSSVGESRIADGGDEATVAQPQSPLAAADSAGSELPGAGSSSRRRRWFVPLLLAVVAVAIGVVLWTSADRSSPPASSPLTSSPSLSSPPAATANESINHNEVEANSASAVQGAETLQEEVLHDDAASVAAIAQQEATVSDESAGAGDDGSEEKGAAADTGDEVPLTPGDGVSVTMGQASWSSGYFQAQLYRQLLEELGYTVSDPAELEFGPDIGYIAMAEGQMDFWANSWYPGHLAWLAGELADGSLVGDHLTVVGEQMIAGGLQGFLVTKSFADEFGVYTMDALNSNADALAAFDATDPIPNNGKADIFGCPEVWTCDNIITSQILFSGWGNINQISADYDAMFTQAVDAVYDDVPMVAYTWTPSAYIIELLPGDNVYWMGVDEILDDSNPSGTEGGEAHSQRGDDGTGGYAAIGPDQCPSAADNADGLCPIGWIAADILVTANNDFLAANPPAAALLEAVRLSVIEVSLANVEQGEGANPGDLATDWIANNRATVDVWLGAARAAG